MADNSTFVAGHYTASYASLDIGTTEVGFELRPTYYREDIKIDDFGDAIVDGIYRGYNLRLSFELSQWAATGRELLQFPFDLEDAGSVGTIRFVGRTVRSFSAALVLTPVADINTNNNIFTFPEVTPDGDHGAWNLNTKLRRVRCNLLVLIGLSSGLMWTES